MPSASNSSSISGCDVNVPVNRHASNEIDFTSDLDDSTGSDLNEIMEIEDDLINEEEKEEDLDSDYEEEGDEEESQSDVSVQECTKETGICDKERAPKKKLHQQKPKEKEYKCSYEGCDAVFRRPDRLRIHTSNNHTFFVSSTFEFQFEVSLNSLIVFYLFV